MILESGTNPAETRCAGAVARPSSTPKGGGRPEIGAGRLARPGASPGSCAATERGIPVEQVGRLRVLVVEDDFLIGRATVSFLHSVGYATLGPFPDSREALEALTGKEVAAGVLDVSLLGGDCLPVADELKRRGVPFLFLTGYSNPCLVPTAFHDVPRLMKPANREQLRSTLRQLLS